MAHKRDIDFIVIHCSASGPKTTVKDIRRWHVKGRGWKDIGYHIVIENDGAVRWGRDIDKDGDVFEEIGAHVKGYNLNSIGICMVGGIDGNGTNHKFSKDQYEALKVVLEGIFLTYGKLAVYGHNDFNKRKSCPCFDVEQYLIDNDLERCIGLRKEVV